MKSSTWPEVPSIRNCFSSYKENSSGSSEKEEDEEDDSAEDEEEEDEPHGSCTADSVAGDGAEEVEAIEKVLCQRVGRKGGNVQINSLA